MPQFIPHSPELESAFGKLKIRQDLINQCITIGIKKFNDWNINTKCRVPCDHRHIPERSYPLYRAREVLHEMLNDSQSKGLK